MKWFKRILVLLLILVVLGGILIILDKMYDTSPFLQNAFGNTTVNQAGIRVPTDEKGGTLNLLSAELGGKLSMMIFVLILLLQISSFAIATKVFTSIRRSKFSSYIKDEKLKNADIFCDLPLYIGLFGTVSSFLLISFSPQSSRLVAYSSTLIGIIFSVVIRLSLVYPAKQELLVEDEKK